MAICHAPWRPFVARSTATCLTTSRLSPTWLPSSASFDSGASLPRPHRNNKLSRSAASASGPRSPPSSDRSCRFDDRCVTRSARHRLTASARAPRRSMGTPCVDTALTRPAAARPPSAAQHASSSVGVPSDPRQISRGFVARAACAPSSSVGPNATCGWGSSVSSAFDASSTSPRPQGASRTTAAAMELSADSSPFVISFDFQLSVPQRFTWRRAAK
mmetsp:Transcript_757/g.2527  ORF Transcript_757/g.2527 Transcript_757/m.2527 type:complete len:217 (+) Transcript_757:62-712(+)